MNIPGNSYNLIPISENISDNDKPLSFQIWKNSFEVILPEQAYTQYNEYLLNWYKNKKATKNDLKSQIKINFLNLLRQIQVFFTEEEKESWYTGINIDNEKEVLLAIPYFARKLKDISLYYLQLRQEIKRSKIKYNLAGSNKSAVKQIQDIILQNYTKKDNNIITLPSTIWKNVPQLSSLKNNLVIEVEELYDTASYFDRTVNLPASAYFSLEAETEKYFTQKGINLTDIDWVYRLGTFTVSALYDSNLQGTTGSELCGLYFDLAKKYLGSDRYSTLIIPSSSKKDFYTIDIQTGNNFFYYPSGPYKINVTGLPRYTPTPLSATQLQTLGTAGSSIELADTIFLKTATGTEGAWFRKKVFDIDNINIKATIEGPGTTTFRFPYPGYGISAEDIEWTGYSAVTDPRFFYLDETARKLIEQVYWSSSFSLSGIVPLPINSTSLINIGAYPSTDFNTADKVRIWPIPPQYTDSSYSGTVQEAWLYKFLKTNISVGSNTDSTIIWPYYKIINPKNEIVPDLPYNVCLSETLSSLSLPFATGSNNISSADVVYKITNYQDTKINAIEAAWLSASNYEYPDKHTYGPKQTHFSAIFKPGTFTYFVWDFGTDVEVDDVIPGLQTHLPDCKFVTTPNTTYNDHKLCTCRQVLFTPFGHPGQQYTDFNGLADFIIEDTGYLPNGNNFDVSSWRDQNGLSFTDSPAACWFKTINNIGWGLGAWHSGSPSTGNKFYLKRGKRYVYYRANVRTKLSETEEFPELVVRYQVPSGLQSQNRPGTWITATKTKQNVWLSTGVPSKMVVNSNDILIYSRAESTYFNITGSYTEPLNLAENRGSIWSNYDYITTDYPNRSVVVSYPLIFSYQLPLTSANNADFYKQYPEVFSAGIQRIALWKVTGPDGSSRYYPDQPTATFLPTVTGLYTVAMTAVTGVSQFPATTGDYLCDGYYYFSNIPPITCVPNVTEVQTVSTFNTPIPGFVLETNLKGWSYITNKRATFTESLTGASIGAVPIWVKSSIDKNFATDYKSVESWSPGLSFIDKYNPIQQPEISDIVLKGGEYLEYKRIPQTRIIWDENITIKNSTDENEWCKIRISQSDNTTPFTPINSLISYQTTEPSTLVLQNIVENEPVEVYYNALTPFTWSITAEPQLPEVVFSAPISSNVITSTEPWSNLTNQFYPTVAFLPSFDSFHSNKELGNYFKPNNLGILTYINKDYTFNLTFSAVGLSDIYETPSKKINNRGLTNEDQFSPYSIKEENNIWLKEPFTTGSLAGTIKKDIFKRYQKFIPYQSTYESIPQTRYGLTTPVSLQHPWGGLYDTEWIDPTNQPISFTGQINVNNWTKDQILKNTELQLDNWSSDIFGNQYGLYKNIKNTTPSQRNVIPGQLWVRNNIQRTKPGYIALTDLFDTYQNLSLYHELTGFGINRFEVFFDTFYIETSGAIIFEKIQYDYSQSKIFSIADSARGISLAIPATNNLNREFTNTLPLSATYAKPGDTWFFAKEKIVYASVVELKDYNLVPSIYALDINKNILKKVFTLIDAEHLLTLKSLSATTVSRPVMSYCSSKKEFLYTLSIKDTSNKNSIISLIIKQITDLQLDSIKIYTPQSQEQLPPTILTNLSINLTSNQFLQQQIDVVPVTSIFESIDFPDWALLTTTGLLTCTAPTIPNVYNLQFKVTNSVGPVYSSLSINVT